MRDELKGVLEIFADEIEDIISDTHDIGVLDRDYADKIAEHLYLRLNGMKKGVPCEQQIKEGDVPRNIEERVYFNDAIGEIIKSLGG